VLLVNDKSRSDARSGRRTDRCADGHGDRLVTVSLAVGMSLKLMTEPAMTMRTSAVCVATSAVRNAAAAIAAAFSTLPRADSARVRNS